MNFFGESETIPIICPICHLSFNNIKSMTNHRRWHDLPQYKKFQNSFSQKVSIFNFGNRNGKWVGSKISIGGGRLRAQRYYKLGECFLCHKKRGERHHKDGDPINNSPENILILCRKCHMITDGRIEKLKLKANNMLGRKWRRKENENATL